MPAPLYVAHIIFNRTGMSPRIETFEESRDLDLCVEEMQKLPEVESISTYRIMQTLNRKSVWVEEPTHLLP